ncbi:NAD-dependent malic enzyme [Methylomonas sp. HYX-M1]|uniref:NAD-dependent malic enzyme n=1 Tax=Methylomonas sp. HYX-M1 TaxID=3139307 RepID=UPI00345B735E
MTSPISDYFDYRLDDNGAPYLAVSIRGIMLLRLPATNKGTAFTIEERIALGLDGMLPPEVTDLERQLQRLYANYQKQPDDLSKYQYLRALQERSEVAFYALLERHLEAMVPIVYTPTIGLAVQQFSASFTTARGLTVSAENVGRIEQILHNYPWQDIRMLVVTDSSAILGIGDQGMGGLAICIGKLALYTAGGGLCPFQTLPVNLDVGTNSEELLNAPDYLGTRNKRLSGEAYLQVVDRFVAAVRQQWPKAVIQWEDFAKNVAFEVLERYRDSIPCINDDIQGTGAVALAGLINACRKKGETLGEQTVVIAGAGAGGIGVASVIRDGLIRAGLSEADAKRKIYVIDAHGLVATNAPHDAYKLPLARSPACFQDWGMGERNPSLLDVVRHAKPSVLIGLSGVAGLFDETLIRTMAKHHSQPIVFPLSNPNANCEAVPADIYRWTEGRAIVATGSPFGEVEWQGQPRPVGQGNNAFIFPGLGFAAVLGECRRISDAMVLESAYALADYTAEHWLEQGLIYPPIADLREVSLLVAERVLAQALADGSATRSDLAELDLAAFIRAQQWQAQYLPFKYRPAATP